MEKLVALFGLVSKQDLDAAEKHISILQKSIKELRSEKDELNTKLFETKLKGQKFKVPVIKVDEEDPEPQNQVARKNFIARVAGFHFDILSKKIKRMISDVRAEAMSVGHEMFGYTPGEWHVYLKGTENALWLIHEWGEMAVSEKTAGDKGEDSGELTESEKEDLKIKLEQ